MKKDLQYKFMQLGNITVIWMIIGFAMSVYDHLVLISKPSQGPVADYSFAFSAIRSVAGALMGAIFGGTFMIFHVNVKYRDKPYGYTVAAVSISFFIVVVVVIFLIGLITIPIETGKSLSDPETKQLLYDFVFDPTAIKTALGWSFFVAITQLFLQVGQKFGRGTFWNLLIGRYQTPREEQRVFMFLDLNSSTSLAEKLGDKRYHMLLKEFFADITEPILENNGLIYQYVGDEVVVAWTYRDGIMDNSCVNCFYDIRKRIESKRDSYMSTFGVVPTFKAGIHCGKIVAGEIGIIKRDVTYSGDVLNTTSRIQGMCKNLGAELIVSGDVSLLLKNISEYVVRPLGQIQLRGKESTLILNSVEPIAI